MERQLDHAMIGGVARFAVGPDRSDVVELSAAGTGDKLTDAFRIGSTLGILRREALIDVIVAGDYNVSSMGVENFKQPPRVDLAAMSRARAKQRMMPIGQRAV